MRPIFWWREQQVYAGVDFAPEIRHPKTWGRPRRFEDGMQTDWMMKALEDHY